ncbi:NADPH:quinone reductase-like Zn-dependent oxidoreductase [Bradyrhizobium yuanmingense]|uniref:hypothetical protein n=1 Tax=Bradyrhizobium yuanmingense TaxID=108015 RepID=UPI0035167ECD
MMSLDPLAGGPVKACGIIPKNMIAHYAEWFQFLPLPLLPAIRLDASGDVVEVGSLVNVNQSRGPGGRKSSHILRVMPRLPLRAPH